MLTHSKALWRIEYRTDLTRTQGPVLPVGFVLEARWSNDVRWLGMLFRKRLMPIELDHVDLKTWPEMAKLEPFMNEMFEETWDRDTPLGDGEPPLGSALTASQYGIHGSLQFVSDVAAIDLSNDDPETSMVPLYAHLIGLHGRLAQTLVAPIVPLPRKEKVIPAAATIRGDVEQMSRAA
jgi:hypothetical protein